MLQVVIPAAERYDEATNEFIETKEQTLQLEHSLISISKWEERNKHCFLSALNAQKLTHKESIDYIRCMTINHVADQNVYNVIPPSVLKQVSEYMSDPASATKISEKKRKRKKKGKVIKHSPTSEVIYSQMARFGIPAEYQKWRLNRLLNLISLCAEYEELSEGGGGSSRSEQAAQRQALNAKRRAKHGTRG